MGILKAGERVLAKGNNVLTANRFYEYRCYTKPLIYRIPDFTLLINSVLI